MNDLSHFHQHLEQNEPDPQYDLHVLVDEVDLNCRSRMEVPKKAKNPFICLYSRNMYQGVTGTETFEISLESLYEKSPYTLLYFYPKDDTPGCTIEAQEFTASWETFHKLWIQIVWVSRDDLESHCSFIGKYSLSPTYLSDPEAELHKEYWAWWEKNNYGKRVTWVIRSTVLVDQTGTTILQRNNVKATGHAQRVLKEITTYLDKE